MKLTLKGIADKKAWEEAGIALPRFDIAKVVQNTKKRPAGSTSAPATCSGRFTR